MSVAMAGVEPLCPDVFFIHSARPEYQWIDEHLAAIQSNTNNRHWGNSQRIYAKEMRHSASRAIAGFHMEVRPLSRKEKEAVVESAAPFDYEKKTVAPTLLCLGMMLNEAMPHLSDGDIVLWARTFDQTLTPFERDCLLSMIPACRYEAIFSKADFKVPVNHGAVAEMRHVTELWNTEQNRSWSYWQEGINSTMMVYYGSEETADPLGLHSQLGFLVRQYKSSLELHKKPSSSSAPMAGYETVSISHRLVGYRDLENVFTPIEHENSNEVLRASQLTELIATVLSRGVNGAIVNDLEQFTVVGVA